MMLKSGVVEAIKSRDAQYGVLWSIKVDNVYYSTKKVEPKCKKGDHISFEASQNEKGYWDADPKTIKLVVAEAPAVPTKTAIKVDAYEKEASASKKQEWVSDVDKQNSIVYQNARNAALELVGLLLSKDLIDFGKTKGAGKIELIETFLDRYTVRFQEDTKRLAPPEALEASGAVKFAPKEKAEQDSDDFDDDLPDMFR